MAWGICGSRKGVGHVSGLVTGRTVRQGSKTKQKNDAETILKGGGVGEKILDWKEEC